MVSDEISRKTADKTMDLVIQAAKLTPELLQAAMQAVLNKEVKQEGQVSIGALAAESGTKLDNIEITDANIKDFKRVADKHHVKYALKRDSGAEPPVYHVFFQTAKAENFQKAFAEYAGVMQEKVQSRRYELPREKQQQLAADLKKSQQREQVQEKKRSEIQL